jgi:hypothetical protein
MEEVWVAPIFRSLAGYFVMLISGVLVRYVIAGKVVVSSVLTIGFEEDKTHAEKSKISRRLNNRTMTNFFFIIAPLRKECPGFIYEG